MITDERRQAASLGGHLGAALQSSADLGKIADASLTLTPPLSLVLVEGHQEQRSLNVGNSLARAHAWK
jgi:hypothetical protein